jgi:hypothetical protein
MCRGRHLSEEFVREGNNLLRRIVYRIEATQVHDTSSILDNFFLVLLVLILVDVLQLVAHI